MPKSGVKRLPRAHAEPKPAPFKKQKIRTNDTAFGLFRHFDANFPGNVRLLRFPEKIRIYFIGYSAFFLEAPKGEIAWSSDSVNLT